MTFKKGEGRWKPDQSGNPGGKPKIPQDVRDLARSHTVEAITMLARQMRKGSVVAAKELLDRAWGRPEQSIDVTGELKGELFAGIDVTIAMALRAALQQLEAPQDEATPLVIEHQSEDEADVANK
jgi:hypothetical protein